MRSKDLVLPISEPGKKIDMAKHLIITTVGTSVFTNFNKREVNDAFKERRKDYSPLNLAERENESALEYDEDIYKSLEDCIKSKWLKGIQKKEGSNVFSLSEDASAPNSHASAEITSLLKIAEKLRSQDEEAQIEVQLLATDTALSVSAAKLIEKFPFPEGIHVRPFNEKSHFVDGLRVNREDFERVGLKSLIQQTDDVVTSTGLMPEMCGLNITGGYKGVIPHITLYGQVKGIPIYYIFENSEHLIQIPQAPLSINWAMFAQHYSALVELQESGTENWEKFRSEHGLFDHFDLCIWRDPQDGSAMLNGLGEFFLEKFESYRFIEVLSNGPLVRTKPSEKNQLKKVLEGLFQSLDTFFLNNPGLETRDAAIQLVHRTGGDIFDHAGKQSRDWFISKYPQASPEVRILYSFGFSRGRVDKLRIWDFRMGGFNHSSYIREFEAFVQSNDEGEWVPFLQVYAGA